MLSSKIMSTVKSLIRVNICARDEPFPPREEKLPSNSYFVTINAAICVNIKMFYRTSQLWINSKSRSFDPDLILKITANPVEVALK